MQSENRLFDDLARVATGALGTLTGMREEVEARLRDQVERMLGRMNLVRREEFDAVQAMAQSSQHVEASVEQAQRAAAALDGISQRVTRITAMSQQIAAAVEEQSAVSEDINRNIIGIRNAGEVTVNAGQQSQLSSGDVAGLADDLRRLAEEFWSKRRQ